jgi:hypothetical protein
VLAEIINNLHIPNNCKINKKLFKKQFKENFSLNSSERKLISNVESITLEYLLNKDNINIVPFVDVDSDYSEVAYIKVNLHNHSKLQHISNIIQNIPYPLIVFYHYKNTICIEVSPKRINKNDTSKLVVVENYFTTWINLENISDIEKEFIKSLDIQNQPFINFLSFYTSYLDKIISFNASKFSGILNINENTKEILAEISSIDIQKLELKNKIKKENNFSDKVNMNIQLKKLNDKLKDLKGKL